MPARGGRGREGWGGEGEGGGAAGELLTVVGEDVAAGTLIHHVALGQGLVPLALGAAGAVLGDEARDGARVQDVCGGALWRGRGHAESPGQDPG